VEFTPARPGLYLYHSQVVAAADLGAGLYSGQAGALLVEPVNHPGRYDREWLVVLKGCEPFMRRTARGCEVGYSALTLNGHLSGQGEPLRANTGDRVLLHVLNAGATESYNLELPGHVFEVTALDGNPLPAPITVASLQLSPGERVSAHVVVNQPTAWRLRETFDSTPDLRRFGAASHDDLLTQDEPDAVLPMVLTRHAAARSGLNRWSINGTTFSTVAPPPLFRVRPGGHYRLQIHNTSDEIMPLHLQRHRLQVAGVIKATGLEARVIKARVIKDIVVVGPQRRVEVDFRAEGGGPTLFHCTRQLHADFGLRGLIDYT
jgi:FtsP/CotA-like multicopper oxidase with cupredoxin domain